MHTYFQYLDLRSCLLGLGIFLVIFWWIKRRHKHLPPGPLGWPVLGYLPNLSIALYQSGEQPFQLFAKLSDKYGKVYSMYMGSKLVVILNGHESIKEAFQNPLLNDRPALTTISETNTGVLFGNGHIWRRQRRFTLSTFRDFGIGKSSFQDQISEENQFLSAEFVNRVGKPFDPKQLLTNAISNVICSVIFGKRFQYSDTEFNHLLELLDNIVQLSGSGGFNTVFPVLKFLDFSKRRKIQAFTKDIRAFIAQIILDHQAKFDSNYLTDYVDVYLQELQHGEFETDNLDEQSLRFTVIQLFVAGTETTVNTLRWALLYMMDKPEIQTHIQQEIDSVVGRNRLPKMSDRLPYTEATIMEVQRMASIVPLGVPHSAAEDTTLQGFTIPKGCMIFSNLWAIHHDPDLWSEPEIFQPERFLNEDGGVFQPEYYFPFSTGRRMCLGENLARMELFIVFTHLLHRFTFSKPKESPPLSFKGRMGATNSPEPFQVMVTERD